MSIESENKGTLSGGNGEPGRRKDIQGQGKEEITLLMRELP